MDLRKARIIKTKAALKQTFVSLMDKYPPHSITVVQLCRKAGLNRSSFYAHYGIMDDLIRDILHDAVTEICSSSDLNYTVSIENGGVPRTNVRDYLDSFLANDTLLKFCTCEDSDRFRTDIIRIQAQISMNDQCDTVSYYPAYFQNSGVLSMLLEWIKNGMSIPKEELIEIIHQFSKAMYYPF